MTSHLLECIFGIHIRILSLPHTHTQREKERERGHFLSYNIKEIQVCGSDILFSTLVNG